MATVAAQSNGLFVHEARPDIASGYPGNALVTSDVRLAALRTWTDGALIRDYRLAYQTSAAADRTENCVTTTTFGWKPENAEFTSDVNGDGLKEFVQA